MNKIIHGDCLEEMKNIPDGSIDAIITDPPYGTTACKWDVVIPFSQMWDQLHRIIKPNGAIALFGSEPFSSYLRMSNIKNYKYDWVWCKNMVCGFALAKKQPMRNHEIISLFYQKQCHYYPIKEKRNLNASSQKRYNYDFNSTKGKNEQQNGIKRIKFIPEDITMSYPKTIKKFNCLPPNHKTRLHPTQKPIKLIEYLIKTYTNEGETVLDFTSGSGTTAIACLKTKRNYICIEKEKKYIDITNKRIKNHTSQLQFEIDT